MLIAIGANNPVAADQPVAAVIDTSKGVNIECGNKAMKLSIAQSLVGGLDHADLQPLEEDCFGYYSVVEGETFVYTVPLTGCGAKVTVSIYY